MRIYKNFVSFFKNIHFQSLLGNGVVAVFGMVTLALLYRALSIKDLGIYIFFTTMLGLADTIRSGFLTNSFIKFYSGTEKDKAHEIAGSAWCLALLITFGCIVLNILALLFSSFITNDSILLLLKYFWVITLVTLPSFMANLIVQGDKRFDKLLWLRLINQVLFTGAVLALIILDNASLIRIVITYIVSNLISSLCTIIFGWSMIRSIFKASKESFLQVFHFGKFSVGTSLSANLFHVTNTLFITFFLGPAALAIYNLGGRLLQIVEIPLLSFAGSGMPSLSEQYNKGDKEKMMLIMKKMTGMLSIAILCAAMVAIIFAEPIIVLVGGAKYIHTEAPNLFRIFMIFAIFYPADRFFALTLDVIHLPKINFYKILLMLGVNLAGNFVAVMLFHSVYAIAISTFFPTLVAIFVTYTALNRYYKFSFWSIYKIGYQENLVFVKQGYKLLLGNERQSNS